MDRELVERIRSGRYVVDPQLVAAAMLSPDGRRRARALSPVFVATEALDRLPDAVEEQDPAPFQDAA